MDTKYYIKFSFNFVVQLVHITSIKVDSKNILVLFWNLSSSLQQVQLMLPELKVLFGLQVMSHLEELSQLVLSRLLIHFFWVRLRSILCQWWRKFSRLLVMSIHMTLIVVNSKLCPLQLCFISHHFSCIFVSFLLWHPILSFQKRCPQINKLDFYPQSFTIYKISNGLIASFITFIFQHSMTNSSITKC